MGDEQDRWDRLRPELESVVFREGIREVARAARAAPSTIYRLMSGVHERPQPRTLRDLEDVIGVFSRTQHPAE